MNIKRMYRKYREQTGSALIAVLIVFVVFVVLGAAVISLSLASGSQTQAQIYQQQAYFAAKSAVSATMNYIQNNSDLQTSISNTAVNATLGGNVAMTGQNITNPTVTITKKSASSLKVASTATVHGVSATAIAYMKNTGSTGTTVNPFDNIFYVSGNNNFNFTSNTTIYGNIYTEGSFDLDNSATLNGDIYAKNGFIIDRGGATVNGNIYTQQAITYNQVPSSVYSLTGLSFTCNRRGTTTVRDFIKLGTNSTIPSNVQCPNITKGATLPTWSSPFDFSNVINNINSFPLFQNTSVPGIQFDSSKTISSSFKLLRYNNGTPTVTITIDTSAGDVCMFADSSYFGANPITLKNTCINVTGNNNFYVYLTGNTTLQLSGGDPIITMQNYNSTNMQNPASLDPPHIFVIGTGSQTVYLANDAEIDGYVFLPNGTFKSDGDKGHNGYCVFGGVIADSIPSATGSSGTWQHVSPNLSGTPLEHMGTYTLPGSGGGGTGSWTLDGWADK